MKTYAYHVLSLLVILTLGACGAKSSLPTEDDGRKAVEKVVLLYGCIKLDSFKKVNAVETDFMGVKMYEMDYQASYSVAKAPCYGKFSDDGKSFYQPPSDKLNQFKVMRKEPQDVLEIGKKFTPGTRKLAFQKKENGWEAKTNTMDIF